MVGTTVEGSATSNTRKLPTEYRGRVEEKGSDLDILKEMKDAKLLFTNGAERGVAESQRSFALTVLRAQVVQLLEQAYKVKKTKSALVYI